MTRPRGNVLQNALAAYLTAWWPSAESAGAGRQGTDVLSTPPVTWECKTAVNFKRDFRPLEWVKQSKGHGGDITPTVYFPSGVGAGNVAHTLAILPTHQLMRLLQEAGYTPVQEAPTPEKLENATQ